MAASRTPTRTPHRRWASPGSATRATATTASASPRRRSPGAAADGASDSERSRRRPLRLPTPPPPERTARRRRRPRGAKKSRIWLPVALVAALIGGLVGAGVTALADNSNNNSSAGLTVHESAATPGAAVLSGNVTIPQLVSKVIPAVVSIDVKSQGNEDEGTGMIITSSGEVVTNNHVIELYVDDGNSGTITVTEYGQTKALPTTLIGYDQTKDVALLKIDNATNLPTVTFGNSSKAVVGDAVVAIGNAPRSGRGDADRDPGHRVGPRPLRHRRGRRHGSREPAEPDPD